MCGISLPLFLFWGRGEEDMGEETGVGGREGALSCVLLVASHVSRQLCRGGKKAPSVKIIRLKREYLWLLSIRAIFFVLWKVGVWWVSCCSAVVDGGIWFIFHFEDKSTRFFPQLDVFSSDEAGIGRERKGKERTRARWWGGFPWFVFWGGIFFSQDFVSFSCKMRGKLPEIRSFGLSTNMFIWLQSICELEGRREFDLCSPSFFFPLVLEVNECFPLLLSLQHVRIIVKGAEVVCF